MSYTHINEEEYKLYYADQVAQIEQLCHGTRYYVGSPCKHHPLNNIRSTSNKTCVVCELLKDYL